MLEKTILLVSCDNNKYNLNHLEKVDDIKYIEKIYGTKSPFYKAYSTLSIFGQKDIYILNLDDWEDIKENEDILKDLYFDYVCPLDLYLDDRYYDDFENKNLYYSQLFLKIFHSTVTTVVFTGEHASVFEDLDGFLDAEKERYKKVFPTILNLKRENIIYVLNNLKTYPYANVVLAAMLCTSNYEDYPESDKLYDVVFDIDYSDINQRMAYFKKNVLTGTTVENLVNFSDDKIKKIVPVWRIIKFFFFNKPNHERFIGRAYADYTRVKIQEELDRFLDEQVGKIIYKYRINSITPISYQPGSVDIISNFDIWPKFTTEKYNLESYL